MCIRDSIYPSCVLPQPLRGLAAHPDTQLTHLKDNLWIASKSAYSYYEKLFCGSGIKLVQGRQTGVGNYPKDAAYNVAWVGRFASVSYTHLDVYKRQV